MWQAMERPSVSQRGMYAELPSPLRDSKCLSGECKPCVCEHSGPSDHLRRDYHHCRSYPLELKQGPFDKKVDFRVANDRAKGYYYHPGTGICMCNDPSSRLNAWARDQPYGSYTRGLPALPGRPWPQWDAWVSPYRRGRGKFYDWYYNELRNANDPTAQGQRPEDGEKIQTSETVMPPTGGAGGKLHRELLHVQRPDPSVKVDQGYRSRWGFDQP